MPITWLVRLSRGMETTERYPAARAIDRRGAYAASASMSAITTGRPAAKACPHAEGSSIDTSRKKSKKGWSKPVCAAIVSTRREASRSWILLLSVPRSDRTASTISMRPSSKSVMRHRRALISLSRARAATPGGSSRIHSRMFRAEGYECRFTLVLLRHWIRTENVDVVAFDQCAAHAFEPNGGVGFAVRPETCRAIAADRHTRIGSTCIDSRFAQALDGGEKFAR